MRLAYGRVYGTCKNVEYELTMPYRCQKCAGGNHMLFESSAVEDTVATDYIGVSDLQDVGDIDNKLL